MGCGASSAVAVGQQHHSVSSSSSSSLSKNSSPSHSSLPKYSSEHKNNNNNNNNKNYVNNNNTQQQEQIKQQNIQQQEQLQKDASQRQVPQFEDERITFLYKSESIINNINNTSNNSNNNIPKSRSSTVAQSVLAYVPAVVANAYQNGKDITTPQSETFEAALFFADVSNFSNLAEQLSQYKDLDGGSDKLTELMNGYLGEIIDTIIAHGGDIIEFAGDAFLAMWKVDTELSKNMSALADVTFRALQCAINVQESVGTYMINSGMHLIELKLRVEIGAGKITGSHMGVKEIKGQNNTGQSNTGQNKATQGRWVYILTGDEVDQTMAADHLNSPGNVVLTHSAWDLVNQHCESHKLENTNVYQVTKLSKTVPVQALQKPHPSEKLKSVIRQYVPNQLVVQQGTWLAEVRNVTMVFIKLPTSKNLSKEANSKILQEGCADIIQSIANFEGMLAHISYDDKGIYAVAVFGIPSHEDDALRAVYTSVQLVKEFHKRGLTLCVGIATGIAVVGSVGSATRSQYTLFGSVVNLSARLMYLAHTNVVSAQSSLSSSSPSPSPSPSQPVSSSPPPPSSSIVSSSSPAVPRISLPSNRPPTPPIEGSLSARGEKLIGPFSSIAPDGRPHSSSSIPSSAREVHEPLQSSRSHQPKGMIDKKGDREVLTSSLQSARSMEARKGTTSLTSMTANTILCDEVTYELARSRFYFISLDPVQLKGFAKKVNCYAPEIMMSWQKAAHADEVDKLTSAKQAAMVGREEETTIFVKAMDKMLSAEGGSSSLVEAEPGQGKSALINVCANLATQKGYSVLVTAADAVETSTPYYAYREILKQLAGINEMDTNESGRQKIQTIVPAKLHVYLAFFNLILALDFKESDISSLIKGEARNDHLRRMMLGLMQQMAREHPTLLVIDDVHWLDSSSWQLTLSAIHQVHPLIVLMGTRPIPTPKPPGYTKLDTLKTQLIRLAPFGNLEINKLAMKTLGSKSPAPQSLVDFLRATTSGNPFFTRELLLVLRDSGVVKLENGEIIHSTKDSESIPRTLNNVIINRVDRLDSTAKLILRVASVIGRNFLWNGLKNVFPVQEEDINFEEKLEILEEAGLVVVPEFTDRASCLAGESPFSFKHVTIQQVIYNSLVAKQRQQLHQSIAEWHATQSNIGAIFPIVYHHYLKAEMHAEALEYCIKSAEYSMSASANKEALEFFNQALASKAASSLSKPQLARIRTLMGDASFALGRFFDACENFRKAIVWCGMRDPFEAIEQENTEGIIDAYTKFVKTEQPAERGSKESEIATEKANIFFRFLLAVVWLYPQNSKIQIYACFNLFNESNKSGWIDTLVGCVSGAVVGYRLYGYHEESQRLGQKVLQIFMSQLSSQQKVILPPAVMNLNARSSIAAIQYFYGDAEITKANAICDKICNIFIAINDVRLITVATALKLTGILMEGKFVEAAEVSSSLTRQCHANGDFTQFGVLIPIYEMYSLIILGRLLECNTKKVQIETAIKAAPPGSIEARALLTFNATSALYELRRGKYESALAFTEPVVAMLGSMKVFLYTYIFAFVAALEVLIALSEQEFEGTALAKEAAKKLLNSFTEFAAVFKIGYPRSLIYEVQFNKYQQDKAISKCKEAIEVSQKHNLLFDEGLSCFELAKCYPRETVQYKENCEKASNIFERIGAIHQFREMETKYYKRVNSVVKL